jgi:tetratricopeptide (TPR) repeat protein
MVKRVRRNPALYITVLLAAIAVIATVILSIRPAPSWELVFEEAFDEGRIGAEWKPLGGLWRVEQSALACRAINNTDGIIMLLLDFPGDVRLEYSCWNAGSPFPGECSAFLCASRERGFDDTYYFGFGANNNTRTVIGDRASGGAEFEISNSGVRVTATDRKSAHRVRVEKSGNHLRIYVDDLSRPTLEITDADPLGGKGHGAVGFYTYSGNVRFDDLKIYERISTDRLARRRSEIRLQVADVRVERVADRLWSQNLPERERALVLRDLEDAKTLLAEIQREGMEVTPLVGRLEAQVLLLGGNPQGALEKITETGKSPGGANVLQNFLLNVLAKFKRLYAPSHVMKVEDAIRYAETYERSFPDDFKQILFNYGNLAGCLRRIGTPQEEDRIYRKAFDILCRRYDIEASGSIHLWAITLHMRGEGGRAWEILDQWEQATEKDPGLERNRQAIRFDLLYYRGDLAYTDGDTRKAFELFSSALALYQKAVERLKTGTASPLHPIRPREVLISLLAAATIDERLRDDALEMIEKTRLRFRPEDWRHCALLWAIGQGEPERALDLARKEKEAYEASGIPVERYILLLTEERDSKAFWDALFTTAPGKDFDPIGTVCLAARCEIEGKKEEAVKAYERCARAPVDYFMASSDWYRQIARKRLKVLRR